MKKHCNIALIVIFLIASMPAFCQSKDSLEIKKAAINFINAFNHFKWQEFRESFADNASIFFPIWDYSGRVAGRKNFEKTWLELFPEFENNAGKDSLTISPQDILIDLYGNTAIMTFHLGDPQRDLSRRTIVWVKQRDKWKIAHLHASRIVNND